MIAALALTWALAADTLIFRGGAGELEVRAPRVEQPAVRIDGDLDEPAWHRAALLTGFTQYNPVEGEPAGAEDTEVRVFYGPDAIYFGIRTHYGDPGAIRANLGERDQIIFRTDWVRIMLDTYNDQRQAYVFYVNPLGSQGDGFWIEGLETRLPVPVDFNIDFIWDSAGHLTDDGWVAEVRIPYKSLRFPEREVHTWGLNIAREARGPGRQWAWAPITANQTSGLAQSGRLVGIRGVQPGRLVELNPVLTGKRVGERTDGEFVREDFSPEFGLNARYGLSRTLVLDATLNPDFSQLEADEGQIAVNERFALYFPEKRPFFLEGTEIFQTPQRLVYTRAVVDPIAGAKLTGKLGGANVGYIGAVDESPITFGEAEGRAIFNLLRLRRDIGSGSTLGAVYADRTLTDGSGYNRVGGVDGRLLFGGRYSLTTQIGGSLTQDSSLAEAQFGAIGHLQLQRAGRTFGWDLRFEDVDPDFRARSGFITRVGDTRAAANARYNLFGATGALIERWGSELRLESFFRHDDFWRRAGAEELGLELEAQLGFRGRNSVAVTLQDRYFAFQPQDYLRYAVGPAGPFVLPFAVPGPLRDLRGVGFRTRLQHQIATLGGSLDFREVPIFVEAARGFEVRASPSLQLRPSVGLLLDLSYTYSRLRRAADESLFSTAQIARVEGRYQFSRATYARAIVQYDAQDRAALLDPRNGQPLLIDGGVIGPREGGDFQYDLLLAYEPSPGTVVYAGWMRLLDNAYDYRFGNLVPVAEGLFLKVSYLWRM